MNEDNVLGFFRLDTARTASQHIKKLSEEMEMNYEFTPFLVNTNEFYSGK